MLSELADAQAPATIWQNNVGGSSLDIFGQRRQQLMAKMDGGVAIFKSAMVANRNNDVDYEYRQDSDFYYLTGFKEPNSAFLLIPGAEQEFIMFVQQLNPAMEIYIGKRNGVEGAMEVFGADTAFTFDKFEEKLPQYLSGKDKVYYSINDAEFNNKLLSIMKSRKGNPPKHLIDPLPFVHEMRLIKDAGEIDLMKRSIEITSDAHIEAIKAVEPGMYEYEIEAIVEYIFRKNGCQSVGFPSIVGSGPNSTVLHYELNDRETRSGEVIVIDIGAEFGYYSADITRTIPVNGRFSKEQKEIYEVVLEAQQMGINSMAPGIGLNEIRQKIEDVIKDGLYRLGLITDTESKWQYRVWYPHGPCHWLGLDVHDVGNYYETDKKPYRILEVGMVTTVEPGIYIGENTLNELLKLREYYGEEIQEEEINSFIDKVRTAADKYTNIGIRIEDDVLITESGHEVLSAKAPKNIKEIEKLMKKSSYINK
jgi:Xaa-Pro aminopeptidase